MIPFPDNDEVTVCVADFTITLRRSVGCPPLCLETGYAGYVQPDSSTTPDMLVMAQAGIPPALSHEREVLYKATKAAQDFWTICRHGAGYRVITYSQTTPGIIQQVALVDGDFRHWQVYSREIAANVSGAIAVCPLEYPLGPLLFYYLTVNHDALMIHASGIHDGSFGRLFSGFSGVGKSTMARIWAGMGSQIVNDDRLIIRKEGEDYYIHNTPMPYEDAPKKAKLNALYLPYHSPVNAARRLGPAQSVSKLLAYSIVHGYDKRFLQYHLDFLAQLSASLPTTLLGVVPDPAIIDFIQDHENTHPVPQS